MAAWIRKKQTEVTMSKMFYMRTWISTYFLLSLPTVVRETQPWNTTLIPKGITSSLKSEHSDSLTTTIRCTFTAKFWPVINTLQTPGELLVQKHWGKEMPNKHLSLTNIKPSLRNLSAIWFHHSQYNKGVRSSFKSSSTTLTDAPKVV